MAPHQLVLVVEGNLVMLPYWPAIRSEYIDPIIAGLASDTQGLTESPEYALVVFYTLSFQSSCLLQQTGWTNNVEEFGGWLSRIDFCGGGCAEAAVAEGLAEGLAMCKDLPMSSPHSRHCLLIGTTQPHKFPSALRCPPSSLGSQHGATNTPCWLADAHNVASAFPRCGVSLSVISSPLVGPKNVPQVSGPYAALFQMAMEQPGGVRDVFEGMSKKFPHHMVLISERFVSARRALRPHDTPPPTIVPHMPSPPLHLSIPSAAPSSSSQGLPATPLASSWSSNRAPPENNQATMNQQGQQASQNGGAAWHRNPPPPQNPQQGSALPQKPMASSGSAESLEILGSNPAPPPLRRHTTPPAAQLNPPPEAHRRHHTAPAALRGGLAAQQGSPQDSQRQSGEEGGSQQMVRVWAGQLVFSLQGKEVPMCPLEAFLLENKMVHGLTRDWPPKLVGAKLVKQADARASLPFQNAIESIIFKPGKPMHPGLSKLAAQQMGVMVELPRQYMALLYVEDKKKLLGLYCPKKLE
ncbi:putative Mediator complex subunit Med25 [Klebsormidium nitens]|uniref:Mediator of RNA polymerase II transcription subunit 25 n=1 Tax=Klebsormidium nitens TaxID=105231 RepID=A0A1Y1IHD5_KLENI|nr:putative Mediator complex subunit Med25 [Klebsormidium nitens]|eukprot:GAQ90280.1 putative Mediator complex subunit Med25 [Klebsormidium nitens]